MANGSMIIAIPIAFDAKSPPRGMVDFDSTAISEEQQVQLNEQKMDIRRNSDVYIGEHPELTAIVSMIVRATLYNRPIDVKKFVDQFFSQKVSILRSLVQKIMEEPKFEVEGIPYEKCFDFDF